MYLKGVPKLYVLFVILFCSIRVYNSLNFLTYPFGKLVFRLCVFCLFIYLSIYLFYGDRDIKMGHSILRTILKKTLLCPVSIFEIWYCSKHFLSCSISGSKPSKSLFFVWTAFKKAWNICTLLRMPKQSRFWKNRFFLNW